MAFAKCYHLSLHQGQYNLATRETKGDDGRSTCLIAKLRTRTAQPIMAKRQFKKILMSKTFHILGYNSIPYHSKIDNIIFMWSNNLRDTKSQLLYSNKSLVFPMIGLHALEIDIIYICMSNYLNNLPKNSPLRRCHLCPSLRLKVIYDPVKLSHAQCFEWVLQTYSDIEMWPTVTIDIKYITMKTSVDSQRTS